MRHIIDAQLDLKEAPLLLLQVVRSFLLGTGESQSQQISLSKEQRYCNGGGGGGENPAPPTETPLYISTWTEMYELF